MSETYIEVYFKCSEAIKEILMAEMANIQFDSFWENEDGFLAYISEKDFNESSIRDILEKYTSESVTYSFGTLAKKNWNEEWEKNFEPIWIESGCYIRATFHPPRPDAKLELLIEPKMSFGTGHHPTTRLMLQTMMTFDFFNKKVMDAGCGTSILSIAAEKLGASFVYGFDLDDWAVENSKENFLLNKTQRCKVEKGSIATVFPPHDYYNILLANINKNVLLEEMHLYASFIPSGGNIFLSGFFEYDSAQLIEKAETLQLELMQKNTEDGWCVLVLCKKYY